MWSRAVVAMVIACCVAHLWVPIAIQQKKVHSGINRLN